MATEPIARRIIDEQGKARCSACGQAANPIGRFHRTTPQEFVEPAPGCGAEFTSYSYYDPETGKLVADLGSNPPQASV